MNTRPVPAAARTGRSRSNTWRTPCTATNCPSSTATMPFTRSRSAPRRSTSTARNRSRSALDMRPGGARTKLRIALRVRRQPRKSARTSAAVSEERRIDVAEPRPHLLRGRVERPDLRLHRREIARAVGLGQDHHVGRGDLRLGDVAAVAPVVGVGRVHDRHDRSELVSRARAPGRRRASAPPGPDRRARSSRRSRGRSPAMSPRRRRIAAPISVSSRSPRSRQQRQPFGSATVRSSELSTR